ncbi:MAG: hypothetical protein DBY02_02280 [Coprobacter fastidiosus]|nr:MAG: hypothetical protein DBY02_02280 [Coprobacter fastidiosus]
MTKQKIFVSAYACEPGLGSEIGVGWHWVLEMSKYFDLWVLTRESNRQSIEPWITEHPEYSRIHFLYFDLPKWACFWKKGMRGVRLYYTIWQWSTNTIVRCIMRENHIEIYHLLTYGNALWPVSRYGKKQCFIWGPTSAGTVIPKDFTRHYRLKSRLKEIIQRFVKKTLFLNFGFRSRCKYADLILCKTDDTIQCVPMKYRAKCKQFTDVAVEIKDVSQYKYKTNENITNFLAAGTLVGWRNFDVLIEAFSEAVKETHSIRLRILGNGDEGENLKRLIQKKGTEDFIEMVGQVKMYVYNQYMSECDVVINPCFREGAVTVSFDSMAFAKPLICFDTKGYTYYFNEDYSRVLKNIKTRKDAITYLKNTILELTNKELRQNLGRRAKEQSSQFDWAHKGEKIYQEIWNCYNEWKKDK